MGNIYTGWPVQLKIGLNRGLYKQFSLDHSAQKLHSLLFVRSGWVFECPLLTSTEKM